jgi:hypothetical protein
MFGRPSIYMCTKIIEKWLLPSFNLKYQQTIIGRRVPNWWSDFRSEWSKCMWQDSLENPYYIAEKWTCSCSKFKSSCFFLCQHLVKSSQKDPQYHTFFNIQDQWPFIYFLNQTERNAPLQPTPYFMQNSDSYNPSDNSNNSPVKDHTSYETIDILVKFLSEHLQEIRLNQNQLKALNNSLKSAFKYMQDVEKISKSNEIPRTWKDLNENTMYL